MSLLPRSSFPALALVAAGLLAPLGARAEDAPDPHAHCHEMARAMKRATRSTRDLHAAPGRPGAG